MYERTYGHKYDEARGLSTPEIAKRIRADIKVAIAEGLLPDRWRYSVTSESFSGGSAIRVAVKGCADAWVRCDGTKPGSRRTYPDGGSTATACPDVWCKAREDRPHAQFHDVLTDEATSAKITLERIHGAYNHDGSDSQTDYFDVNYYGQVQFQDARSAEFEQREKERKAARREAIDGATERRTVRVYKRDHRESVTHYAVEVEGKVRLLCGATARSWSVGSADGAEVTCSRCKKKG